VEFKTSSNPPFLRVFPNPPKKSKNNLKYFGRFRFWLRIHSRGRNFFAVFFDFNWRGPVATGLTIAKFPAPATGFGLWGKPGGRSWTLFLFLNS
jgi:hypothetical protein